MLFPVCLKTILIVFPKKKNVFETTKRFLSFFCKKKKLFGRFAFGCFDFLQKQVFCFAFPGPLVFFCFARFVFVFRNSWKETMLLHFVFLRSVALFLLCSCFNAGEGRVNAEKSEEGFNVRMGSGREQCNARRCVAMQQRERVRVLGCPSS